MSTGGLDLVVVPVDAGRFNPKTFSFEWIGRQRQSVPAFVRIKAGPVHGHARQPESPERGKHGRNVDLFLFRVAQRRDGAVSRGESGVLSRQRGQGLPRTDLQ